MIGNLSWRNNWRPASTSGASSLEYGPGIDRRWFRSQPAKKNPCGFPVTFSAPLSSARPGRGSGIPRCTRKAIHVRNLFHVDDHVVPFVQPLIRAVRNNRRSPSSSFQYIDASVPLGASSIQSAPPVSHCAVAQVSVSGPARHPSPSRPMPATSFMNAASSAFCLDWPGG